MKGFLLDVNVLLALAWPTHPHHARAEDWFLGLKKRPWATCTITELGFIRLSSNPRLTSDARPPSEARDLLAALAGVGKHERWTEPSAGALSRDVAAQLRRAVGHSQVTDAYLVALATAKGGRVATFDAGLRAVWGIHVELVP
jgi:toxin-antitoxin system PIN domain toxin